MQNKTDRTAARADLCFSKSNEDLSKLYSYKLQAAGMQTREELGSERVKLANGQFKLGKPNVHLLRDTECVSTVRQGRAHLLPPPGSTDAFRRLLTVNKAFVL